VRDLPPLPLPADPALAAAAAALEQGGHWADLVDREWGYAFMTSELRIAYGGFSSPARPQMGTFYFGPDAERERTSWPFGPRRSEALIERLGADDAAALALDLDQIVYTPLGEIAGATEKARRDAPAIAVCEV
jgi:hypothetical protein